MTFLSLPLGLADNHVHVVCDSPFPICKIYTNEIVCLYLCCNLMSVIWAYPFALEVSIAVGMKCSSLLSVVNVT